MIEKTRNCSAVSTALAIAAGMLFCPAADWANAARPGGKHVFRAGAHAVDVSPREFPVIVNGGMRERTASTLNDPLYARCLVLDDGTNRIAFAVVDNCVIPGDLMDEAKELANRKTGIPVNRMLISATHAHSCPSLYGVLGSDRDETYAKILPGLIAEGIAAAAENLAPAQIGWAVGSDPENVFCRRFIMKPGTAKTNPFGGTKDDQAQMNPGFQNPNAVRRTGPADTDVSVLSVRSIDGEPIALLANYSTHYVGAPPISSDYFGIFCARIGELIGAESSSPPFVGMLSNGTSGDANCNDFVNPKRDYDRFTVAEDVAQAAFEAYKTIAYYDWVPLVMEERRLTLDVRMPGKEEVGDAKKLLAELEGRKPQTIPEVYARETVVLSSMSPTRELKLQAIRIGELGIAAMPNEVFGVTGLAIKRESPLRPTFSIELANGYHGYLAPPDQHKLGGYTTWRARSSCLEVNAEPKVKSVVLELLDTVSKQRTGEKLVPSE